MITPVFRGKLKKGVITLDDPAEFAVYKAKLEGMNHEGIEIEYVLRKRQKKRSMPQNRYYWSVVVRILCDHTGFSPEEMHDALRMMFLVVHRDGLPDTVKSTTDLSTVEFSEYVDKIIQWAAVFHDAYIPLPGEAELSDAAVMS